ncbi:hypothetical protein VTN02DRAFT_4066 [Thermoascus thermophilus]
MKSATNGADLGCDTSHQPVIMDPPAQTTSRTYLPSSQPVDMILPAQQTPQDPPQFCRIHNLQYMNGWSTLSEH